MAVNIFSLFGSIMVDSDEANKSIQKTGDNAKSLASKMGSGLKAVGKAAAGIATAAAGAAASAGAAIKSAVDDTTAYADEIDKASLRSGLGAENLQKLKYAAEQSGASLENIENTAKKFNQQLGEISEGSKAGETAAAAFDKLGISIYDAEGKMRGTDELYNEVLAALADMPDSAERTAIATDLMGKGFTDLKPLMDAGSDGIKDLMQNAEKLGIVMGGEDVKAGVKLGDTIADIKTAFSGMVRTIGTSVVPLVQKFADKILAFMPKIQSFVDKLLPPIEKLTGVLLDTLGELMDKVLPPLLDLASSLIEPASKLIESVLPVIVKLLDKAAPILVEIVQELLPPLLDILDAFMPILDVLFEILDPILDVVKALIKPLAEVLKAVEPLITSVVNFVDRALTPFKTEIKVASDILSTVLGPALEAVQKIIEYYIMPAFDTFTAFLQGDFDKGVQIATEAFTGAFEGAFAIIDSLLGTNLQEWYQEFNQFWQNIGAGLYAALNGDKINENELHGKYSGIAQDVRLAANENMRNGMTADEALAAAKAKYLKSNEALYYWDNYGNYNADEAYVAIQETKAAEKQAWQEKSNYYTQHYGGIPKLAGGGMVYGDTLAVVGDNVGAASNPEVVAPLDELSKIIAKALDSVADKIIAANSGGDIVCQLPDGTELARWTADNINRLSRQEGKCVIKGVG